MELDHRGAIAVLRESHDHLAGLVAPLDDAELGADSFCSEWNVAQVLSHLGSGAEIALMNLDAARLGDPAPERGDYELVWARWNARTPREMADESLTADEAHVATLEGLSDEELAALSIPAFGGRVLDATGAVLMRLGEHAIHTWDVEVTFSPDSVVQQAAVERLIDRLAERVGRLAHGEKPARSPVSIEVHTSSPERSFVLSFGDEVVLTSGSGAAEGHLDISAEGLLRLVYGRLDASHTPSGTHLEGPVSLEELREAFPGF